MIYDIKLKNHSLFLYLMMVVLDDRLVSIDEFTLIEIVSLSSKSPNCSEK